MPFARPRIVRVMAQGKIYLPPSVIDYPRNGRFEMVARRVLAIEGGHAQALADKGGETQYGISLRFLVAEGAIDANHDGFKDYDLDMDGDIDGADVRALSEDDAFDLYYRCFWRKLDLDRLPAPIDGAVFDQAVNCGCKTAVKLLQKALRRCEIKLSITVDGVLGQATCADALNVMRQGEAHLADLVRKYREEAELHYDAIVRADPSQVEWLNGWVNRARKLGNV